MKVIIVAHLCCKYIFKAFAVKANNKFQIGLWLYLVWSGDELKTVMYKMRKKLLNYIVMRKHI